MDNMQTTIEKDGDGYLAKVKDQPNLFAFAYSEKEAVQELKNVVEMIMDYHLDFKLFVKKVLMLFSPMEETPSQYQSTVQIIYLQEWNVSC